MIPFHAFVERQTRPALDTQLIEGGNIFKSPEGTVLTQRIQKADIPTTIKWLESITQLDLTGPPSDIDRLPSYWLGTTGRKPDSGDLDLMVDASSITKDALIARLEQWARKQSDNQTTPYVKKSGISVHFLTPINGKPQNGFVQTDFMFITHPEWSQFIVAAGDASSQFKGADRFVMINSLAKTLNYKITQLDGLLHRDTNALISRDPDKVAKILLTPSANKQSLFSVERILKALDKDPNRDAKLQAFREYLKTDSRVINRDHKLQLIDV